MSPRGVKSAKKGAGRRGAYTPCNIDPGRNSGHKQAPGPPCTSTPPTVSKRNPLPCSTNSDTPTFPNPTGCFLPVSGHQEMAQLSREGAARSRPEGRQSPTRYRDGEAYRGPDPDAAGVGRQLPSRQSRHLPLARGRYMGRRVNGQVGQLLLNRVDHADAAWQAPARLVDRHYGLVFSSSHLLIYPSTSAQKAEFSGISLDTERSYSIYRTKTLDGAKNRRRPIR